jgi:hypothetical protein
VFGLLDVRGPRLDLGEEGGRFPGGEVSPASRCVHGLGRLFDALYYPSSAPERSLGERRLTGSQVRLGGL